MNKILRTLVVDDHPVVATATSNILAGIEHVQVVGMVGSGAACLEFIGQHQLDLVLLDYNLPDQYGSQVAVKIKEQFPHIHIVIFTGVDVSVIFNSLLDSGVAGVISKDSSEISLKNMIRCIMDGHTSVPLSYYRKMRIMDDQVTEAQGLTREEVQIMRLLVEGSNHEQIGEQIHVSKRTVDNYMKRIYGKLGSKTRAQAVEKFVRSKYYDK